MKITFAALAAAGLLAGSAGAYAKDVEQVSVRVSTAGINFNDPASVEKFRARVDRQIAAICNPGDRLDADTAPDFACRKSMGATAETRIAQLQGRSTVQYGTVGE
jgi:UrcA family protein